MIFKVHLKGQLGDDLASEATKLNLPESARRTIYDECSKWFDYGEYLTVEIDSIAKTIRVVETTEQTLNQT